MWMCLFQISNVVIYPYINYISGGFPAFIYGIFLFPSVEVHY